MKKNFLGSFFNCIGNKSNKAVIEPAVLAQPNVNSHTVNNHTENATASPVEINDNTVNYKMYADFVKAFKKLGAILMTNKVEDREDKGIQIGNFFIAIRKVYPFLDVNSSWDSYPSGLSVGLPYNAMHVSVFLGNKENMKVIGNADIAYRTTLKGDTWCDDSQFPYVKYVFDVVGEWCIALIEDINTAYSLHMKKKDELDLKVQQERILALKKREEFWCNINTEVNVPKNTDSKVFSDIHSFSKTLSVLILNNIADVGLENGMQIGNFFVVLDKVESFIFKYQPNCYYSREFPFKNGERYKKFNFTVYMGERNSHISIGSGVIVTPYTDKQFDSSKVINYEPYHVLECRYHKAFEGSWDNALLNEVAFAEEIRLAKIDEIALQEHKAKVEKITEVNVFWDSLKSSKEGTDQ